MKLFSSCGALSLMTDYPSFYRRVEPRIPLFVKTFPGPTYGDVIRVLESTP